MKRLLRLLSAFLVLLMLFPIVSVKSAVFTVSTPDEFQKALTEAQSNGDNDIIHVAPGVYNLSETLVYQFDNATDVGCTLTIQALDPQNPPVLDGGKSVAVLEIVDWGGQKPNFVSGGSILIKGLTFQNGNCTTTTCEAGGLYISSLSNVTVEDCSFKYNVGDDNGAGGLYVSAGNINILSSSFVNNEGEFGAGAELCSSDGSSILVRDLYFRGNTAEKDGGGICLSHGDNATIQDSIFVDNTARRGGGVSGSIPVTITNNSFCSNHAKSTDNGNEGGGIYIYELEAGDNIYNNIFW